MSNTPEPSRASAVEFPPPADGSAPGEIPALPDGPLPVDGDSITAGSSPVPPASPRMRESPHTPVLVDIDISSGIAWEDAQMSLERRVSLHNAWIDQRCVMKAAWVEAGKPHCKECGKAHQPPHVDPALLGHAYRAGKEAKQALKKSQNAAGGTAPETGTDGLSEKAKGKQPVANPNTSGQPEGSSQSADTGAKSTTADEAGKTANDPAKDGKQVPFCPVCARRHWPVKSVAYGCRSRICRICQLGHGRFESCVDHKLRFKEAGLDMPAPAAPAAPVANPMGVMLNNLGTFLAHADPQWQPHFATVINTAFHSVSAGQLLPPPPAPPAQQQRRSRKRKQTESNTEDPNKKPK
jgi:hypothetical protein